VRSPASEDQALVAQDALDPYLQPAPVDFKTVDLTNLLAPAWTRNVSVALANPSSSTYEVKHPLDSTPSTGSRVRDEILAELHMLRRVSWKDGLFMTLTIPQASQERLEQAHDRFRQSLKAFTKRTWLPEYCIIEPHKSDRPHLHSVTPDLHLDPQFVESLWHQVLGKSSSRAGPSARVETIRHFGAIRYCLVKPIIQRTFKNPAEREFLDWPSVETGPVWPSDLFDPSRTVANDPLFVRMSLRTATTRLRERLLAESFLLNILAAGPVLAKTLLESARQLKAFSQKTLENAAIILKVRHRRSPGQRSPWMWALPEVS
jgi:hypothetical protein